MNRRLDKALMRMHLEVDHGMAPPEDNRLHMLRVIHERAHQREFFAWKDGENHHHEHDSPDDWAPLPKPEQRA
jgi:hypothetical protein